MQPSDSRNSDARLMQRFRDWYPLALMGYSPLANRLREDIDGVLPDANVLIEGERGCGANVIARVLHVDRMGTTNGDADRPFRILDCSDPETHWDSTLFAAFDGRSVTVSRTTPRLRLYAPADPIGEDEVDDNRNRMDGLTHPLDDHDDTATGLGGTIVLRSVDSMPLHIQRQLRHIWNNLCAGRLDDNTTRLIATTAVRLKEQVQRGRFDAQLYDILNQAHVSVPPLRERPEDIPVLLQAALIRSDLQDECGTRVWHATAHDLLAAYSWPGNVDELRNVVRQVCQVETVSTITAEMVEPWLEDSCGKCTTAGISLRQMERKLIEATFHRCHGNRERTASMLRIGLRTLSGKLREYGYPPRGGPGSNRKAA